MTYAKIIADSVSPAGDRITTMEVEIHRFVLAELNTHRVFSRNSASSRAIPVSKQLQRIKENPALPVSWPAEKKGMQGGDELDDDKIAHLRSIWQDSAQGAAYDARYLHDQGLHKSVTNRLLEPFMWHTVVITATAWDNFFKLRLDKMAQPEIRMAAEAMKAIYDESTPEPIGAGEWHTPYLSDIDKRQLEPADWLKVSSARCARVSFLAQSGLRELDEDLRLYNQLTENGHSSPLEHVATPDPDNVDKITVHSRIDASKAIVLALPKYGNMLGWHQLRFSVEAEFGYAAFS